MEEQRGEKKDEHNQRVGVVEEKVKEGEKDGEEY